eukprot:m.368456 g.368456  ORF g.368456 m.368456 type:complete len:160 (-) comp56102_c0_seq6:1180-1659(-)
MSLPRTPSVRAIMDAYLKAAAAERLLADTFATEVVCGVITCFDNVATKTLLYPIEVPQVEEVMGEDPEVLASDLFGAEHLLRLFVHLPTILGEMPLEKACLESLLWVFDDMLMFIGNQSGFFHPSAYVHPSPYYLSVAQHRQQHEQHQPHPPVVLLESP